MADDPLWPWKVISWKHACQIGKGSGKYSFTIQEFKKLKPQLNWNDFILIGHSNGGDMTMLFATRYPQLINKAISMDHRRMIMPRTRNPRLYTLRGCDYDADSGVLPTEKEQEQFRMKVVKLDGITHSNMGRMERKNNTTLSISISMDFLHGDN